MFVSCHSHQTVPRPRNVPSIVILGVAILFGWTGFVMAPGISQAQDRPTVPPNVEESTIQIERGQDVVQPPSLWYQEGNAEPDSLGIIRVPRTGDPDAIEYRDRDRNFPVYLQHATFVREGQVSEIRLSQRVLRGEVPGRIIIRPPAEDFYDIAEPFGVEPIRQEPGEETIIDAREWYRASLQNPATGQFAPASMFHSARELRGRLRSTAPGGERVRFYIVATPEVERPAPIRIEAAPARVERRMVPVTRFFTIRETPAPRVEWITHMGLFGGVNTAELPALQEDRYFASRIRGDVTSTIRINVNEDRAFDFSLYGASQPTLSDDGNHHDAPYGLAISGYFGEETQFVIQAMAMYDDSPFQTQNFANGDQRLRLLFGVDDKQGATRYRLRFGPTYFRDQPSVLDKPLRSDSRQLGASAYANLLQDTRIAGRPFVWFYEARAEHSWGFITDGGNRNFTVDGRVALKRQFSLGAGTFSIGPAVYGQYVNNVYDETPGFDELSLLFGLHVTTRSIL